MQSTLKGIKLNAACIVSNGCEMQPMYWLMTSGGLEHTSGWMTLMESHSIAAT